MNIQATRSLAKKIAKTLRSNNGGVVLLSGVLGAGKTTLISLIIKQLDRSIRPSSPTFTLINKYSDHIYHADLYRLEGKGIEDIGLYDLILPGNYVFIEWGGELKIPNAIRVNITVKEGGTREFIID